MIMILPPYVCVCLVQTNAGHCSEDPVHIAWSSSDGEQSDDETQKQPRPHRPGRPVAPIQSYTRELCMLSTEKGNVTESKGPGRTGLFKLGVGTCFKLNSTPGRV